MSGISKLKRACILMAVAIVTTGQTATPTDDWPFHHQQGNHHRRGAPSIKTGR